MKTTFRLAAHRALSRWRQVGSFMPRLYPSEEQWKKFPPEARADAKSVVTLLEAKGLEDGMEKTKYFINEIAFAKMSQDYKKQSGETALASRQPIWGVPSHMAVKGMDYLDAQAATALMRAEFELCLYVISLITGKDTTNERLIREPQLIWTYISPLWRGYDKFGKLKTATSTPATTRKGRIGRKEREPDLSRVTEVTEEPWNPNVFTPQAPVSTHFVGVRGNTYAGSGILQSGRLGASLFGPTYEQNPFQEDWNEEEPQAFSTPKGKRRATSPPLLDLSANSRTFRIQTPDPNVF